MLYDMGGKPKGRLWRTGKDNNNNNKHLIKYTILYHNKTKTSDGRKKE
jgi:hypothetical protein